MELTLKPVRRTTRSTISELLVDGEHECYILEDRQREIPGRPVEEWKIYGETAIPAGRYEVIINVSDRFSRIASKKAGHRVDVRMPLLQNVPGYSGIRIHPANGPDQLLGCLAPGREPDQRFDDDWISSSRAAYEPLFKKIDFALRGGEKVFINVVRDFT